MTKSIPGFLPGYGYTYEVTVPVMVTVYPDDEPTIDELKTALLDEVIDYLDNIRKLGEVEHYASYVKAELIEVDSDLPF